MINDNQRLPEGGAWMGVFYILPCKDASAHYKQDDRLRYAAEGENVEVSYCNALYCGVYPCFISEAVDVDTTCFAAAWPDESFDLMNQAGELINRALLAYHRGLTSLKQVAVAAESLEAYLDGKMLDIYWEVMKPLMPVFNWEPAPGGAEALEALLPLFPSAPLGMPKG